MLVIVGDVMVHSPGAASQDFILLLFLSSGAKEFFAEEGVEDPVHGVMFSSTPDLLLNPAAPLL